MTLKIFQHNCLDLFIFLDFDLSKPIEDHSDEEWNSLTYSKKENKPLKKIKELADLYLKVNPDILILNEIGGLESLTNFNKHFLNDKYIPVMKEGSSRGIDTGFLIKKKLKFTHKGFSTYSVQGKKKYFSRCLNQLSILDKQGNIALNIFGTHLKSQRGSNGYGETMETRFHEVKAITEILKQEREKSKAPYILAGDLNGNCTFPDFDFEFSELYKNTSLRDIHWVNKNDNQDRYSFVRLYKDIIDFIQLDYILLSKDLHKNVKVVKRFLFEKDNHVSTSSEKENQPSDHYPQFVKIKL